ncbi:MAG: ferritin-like domain-containing protein [Parachlamydiaceae bacterium]
MENQLKDLLVDELHDLLSAELQVVKVLPSIVKASESPDLREVFKGHLKETKDQVQRLGKALRILKVGKKAKFCKGMKGLIDEGKEVLRTFKTKSSIRDAALISKAQRMEHYEISAYGTARTFAREMNLNEVADLLQTTLNEKGKADKKLTKIAEGGILTSGINHRANHSKARKTAKKSTSSKKAVASKR